MDEDPQKLWARLAKWVEARAEAKKRGVDTVVPMLDENGNFTKHGVYFMTNIVIGVLSQNTPMQVSSGMCLVGKGSHPTHETDPEITARDWVTASQILADWILDHPTWAFNKEPV